MKVSENWLREWVDPDLDTAALAEQITMAGLEVDAVEGVAGDFSDVVVGEITAVEPHPNADKLSLCQVDDGSGESQPVICGAPNARQGLKAPFARVGAVLPGDFEIKKAKLRGVESRGMLCAQTELQAGEDDSGLWELPADAPVGTALGDYLGLDDRIIEVDLTPNRGDCLSLRGVAREVGVLNRAPVRKPEIPAVPATGETDFPLEVEAARQCPRYIGRVIRNVDVSRPSPLWLQERLRRAGVRPHDCVVDVTNYVLLELGQPMHAFDRDKLQGRVLVRLAGAGETIELLDGQEAELKESTLVIADDRGPIAMAGVMGGARTAVGEETRNIFLESAFFTPLAVAGQARSYGLHTDASHRYERGVDYELPGLAMERATQLLLDIAGGEPGPLITAESREQLPERQQVNLRKARIAGGLGFDMADEDVLDILERLGLTPENSTDAGWTFRVPSHRFDLTIEEDLLEELARIYGYNRLPVSEMPVPMRIEAHPEARLSLAALKDLLAARGYREAITYSFIAEELARRFEPEVEPVALQNPISADLAVMRGSLWPSLVQTLSQNLKRQQNRVRLFEAGMRFRLEAGELRQEPVLAGLLYGSHLPEGWANEARAADFYDLKGDLEALLDKAGRAGDFAFQAAAHPALHPGQSALLLDRGEPVGRLGALHPRIQREMDVEGPPVLLFEVAQSALLNARLPRFGELSRYPALRRDVAVLVDRELPVQSLLDGARAAAGDYLRELKVFDLYVGKGIDPQRKSVALGLTFQHPSRTLNEAEINAAMESVIAALKEDFAAVLR